MVVFLILLLITFFMIFREEKTSEMDVARESMETAEDKIIMAENLLILRKMEEAKVLFQESLGILQPLTKTGSPVKKDAEDLEDRAKTQLDSIPQEE